MKVKHGYGNLPLLHLKTPAATSEQIVNAFVKRLLERGVRAALVADIESEKSRIRTLSCSHDLVIVSSPLDIDSASARFTENTESAEAEYSTGVFSCQRFEEIDNSWPVIREWLQSCMARTPVLGCVLIGGKSSRMGRPKHLLPAPDGKTWLENTIVRLRPHVNEIVVSGAGELPAGLANVTRIEDLPGAVGPIAGVGSVLEKRPFSSCIVVACDMPDLSAEGISWLLSKRAPGRIAVVPKNRITGHSEPLFAWYDFRCRPCFLAAIGSARFGMHEIFGCRGVYQPEIPPEISRQWRNVNRPEELAGEVPS